MHLPLSSLKTLVVAGALILVVSIGTSDGQPLTGYSRDAAVVQRALESDFARALNRDNPRAWMREFSRRPHHVGSAHGRANAERMVALFRDWGFEAEIETFHVLFPTPTIRSVELLEPTSFTAVLEEPIIAEDPSTQYLADALPSYNAYSADGDVTAELVYVNQGIPGDYDILARMGISVEGKIVIARYGGSWRGIKVKVAAEHGAIGCILYSDPRDDGYHSGDVYPKGPYRNADGAQRGSVADMPLYPGDPLTPGIGATEDADRYSVEESPTIMKIPVLPLSYSDAQPLLAAIDGPAVPEAWRGGLPITYHIGPGPAVVRLNVAFDWSLKPAYNVIARLEGAEHPDEWVMRGNHHDAWVFGARDPVSGLVAMLEEARAIGTLASTGWRPRRTLVYAAWDAEEPGLLGSTEWVEYHSETLDKKLALYINTDSNSRGFFSAGGSHGLQQFVNEVAREVIDPQTGTDVISRAVARLRTSQESDLLASDDLLLSPLGSGSDYTPFLQHAGISSLDMGFSGEAGWGAYHSAYDTYTHYERFGDPDYEYAVTLAEITGRTVLRFANADLLPFTFSPLATHIASYGDEVQLLLDELRVETDRHNGLVADGSYRISADPTERYVPPAARDRVPHIAFAALDNAMVALAEAADAYDLSLKDWMDETEKLPIPDALNRTLYGIERLMTTEDGLPRRPWFQHNIYAPGFYTGYGVKTLPGIREAIEQRDWVETEAEIAEAAVVLGRVAAEILRARNLLTGLE